jgi:hypothetical protein
MWFRFEKCNIVNNTMSNRLCCLREIYPGGGFLSFLEVCEDKQSFPPCFFLLVQTGELFTVKQVSCPIVLYLKAMHILCALNVAIYRHCYFSSSLHWHEHVPKNIQLIIAEKATCRLRRKSPKEFRTSSPCWTGWISSMSLGFGQNLLRNGFSGRHSMYDINMCCLFSKIIQYSIGTYILFPVFNLSIPTHTVRRTLIVSPGINPGYLSSSPVLK